MKKLLAVLLFAGSLVLSPPPARAEVEEATARALMQETGLWDSLESVPAALRDGMQAGMSGVGGALPPDVAEKMLQAVEASFTVERTRASTLQVMRNGLDAGTVSGVRKWNASPLGQKLLAQEKASAASKDPAKRVADGQAALQNADDARRKALADIVAATRAVEGMTEISIGTAVAMMRGIAAANPALAQALPSDEQIRGLLQAQLAGAMQQMQDGLMINLASTYASVSTPELQQYVVHLRSPEAMKLNDLTLAAIGVVLKDGATEMGSRLSALMKTPAPG